MEGTNAVKNGKLDFEAICCSIEKNWRDSEKQLRYSRNSDGGAKGTSLHITHRDISHFIKARSPFTSTGGQAPFRIAKPRGWTALNSLHACTTLISMPSSMWRVIPRFCWVR